MAKTFNITMKHIHIMQITQAIKYLVHNTFNFFHVESHMLPH